jgi:cytochrome o ubiquinol oxidase subunit III
MTDHTAKSNLNHRKLEHEAESKTLFGFWTYLMTDCILFATLFAAYAVLHNNTNGGPGAGELFDMPFVLLETLILLTSSFTCGLAILAARRLDKDMVFVWFGVTAFLGLAFLGLELHEFSSLIHEGNSWRESGFLSAFFTLVGTHGLHITAGLVWIGVLMTQLYRKGFRPNTVKRLMLLSMFWHFLDIVWIFIFSLVYLMGGAAV